MQSVILDNDGFGKLGFLSVAVVYVFSGTFTIFSTSLIAKLSSRVCLGIGAICNSTLVWATILAAIKAEDPDNDSFLFQKDFVSGVILVASAISGFGNSLIWVAAGFYISKCSNFRNKGTYYSIFWILFQIN